MLELTLRGAAAALVAAIVIAAACGSTAPAHANPPEAQTTAGATATPTAPPQADSAPLAGARQLGEAFVEVARRVSPSVVSLRVEARMAAQEMPFRFFGPFGQPQQMEPPIAHGEGSGIIIRQDGYILTNNHVVDNTQRIEAVLPDGRHFTGTVVGTDPASDLAVVHIDATGLPTARFAHADDVRVGEWAIAIGSPLGLDYTVTAGVVSALGRAGLGAAEIEDYVQTDAMINPGNSGGPLVNLDGDVIGINTMIAGRGTGIGFAVPADIARQVADQIIDHGSVQRAWIGVTFQELTPELAGALGSNGAGVARGALVSSVLPGGPAARGGIQDGDIIVSNRRRPGRREPRSPAAGPPTRRRRDGPPRGRARRPAADRRGQDRRAPDGRSGRSRRAGARALCADASDARALVVPARCGARTAARHPARRARHRRPTGQPERARRASTRRRHRRGQWHRASAPNDVGAALHDGSALLRVRRGDGAFFTVLSTGN